MSRLALPLTIAVITVGFLATESKAFPWGGEEWGSFEGPAFATWLRSRGVDPVEWGNRWPQLVRIFRYRHEDGTREKWPPPIDATKRIVKRLDSVLCRYGPQCHTGKAYARSGKRWGINPFYIAAISGIESTFGQASCAPHNAWGIIAYCGSGFPSWPAGIEYATRLIRTLFVDRGLADVWSIGRSYCPPCGNGHGDKAAYYMSQLFHVGHGVLWKNALETVK